MLKEELDVLSSCPLFAGINPDIYTGFFQQIPASQIRTLANAESIFHMSEAAGMIGIVLDGSIRVEKLLQDGNVLTIATKQPGDLIGEAAAFSHAAIYPCELVATSQSKILLLSKDQLLGLLMTDAGILSHYLTELSDMTYALQAKVELESYSGIAAKLAFFLLTASEKAGSDAIPIPDSISHLATILGVSRPSLHREMKKLLVAGILSQEGSVIRIVDKMALRKVLS